MSLEKIATSESDLAEENLQLKLALEQARADIAKKEATLEKFRIAIKTGKETIVRLKANIQTYEEANNSSFLNSSAVGKIIEGTDAGADNDLSLRDRRSAQALHTNSGSFYRMVSNNKAVSVALVLASAAAAVLVYKKLGKA